MAAIIFQTTFSGVKRITWHFAIHFYWIFYWMLSALLPEALISLLPPLFSSWCQCVISPACSCDVSAEGCLQPAAAASPEAQRAGGAWELYPSRGAFCQWLEGEGVPPKGHEHSPPWGVDCSHFCGTLPEHLLHFFYAVSPSLFGFSQEYFPSNLLAQDPLSQNLLLVILTSDTTSSPF